MEMNFLVENEFVEYPGGETSSSLPKSKDENPISASASSKNRATVKKTRSRKFNIRGQSLLLFFVVLLIMNIFICGYYVLIKKLTASSQLAENLSLQLANVVNRTKVMEAAAIVQENKLTASSQLAENLTLQLANVVNRTKVMEAAAIAQENKFIVENKNLSSQLTTMEMKIKSMEAEIQAAKNTIMFTENLVRDELRKSLAQHDNISSQLAKNFSGADQKILENIVRSNKSLEEKSLALLNVSVEMEKMRQRVDKNENLTSQLAKNISDVNGQVMDLKKSIDASRAGKNISQNNCPYKNENLTSQLAKNISDVNGQVMDLKKSIDASRVAKNILQNNCRWLESSNGQIPSGAVVAGKDKLNGDQVYVVRIRHEGALLPGKLAPSRRTARIPWQGHVLTGDTYEVLCNCTPHWLPMKTGDEISAGAFIAGKTPEGEPLYVGRAEQDGYFTPGMVQANGVCYIPIRYTAIKKSNFEIMAL